MALAVLLIGHPLLFATLDENVAAACSVPVKALGLAFLALAGVTAGEATRAAGLAVGETWAELAAAAWIPDCPPSFAIMSAVVLVYAAIFLARPTSDRAETATAAPSLPRDPRGPCDQHRDHQRAR